MKRKMVISVVLLILIVTLILIFGYIWNPFASKQQGVNCLFPDPGNFTSLIDELQTTNTPKNVSFISYYMQSNGVNTVQVRVLDYNSDFYVVRDSGITLLPPSQIDKTIKLKVCHIRQIEGYITNSQLSMLDQLQLSIIYKQDGN